MLLWGAGKAKPGPFPVRGSACPAIKLIIGRGCAEVNITFEESACPKASRQLPYRTRDAVDPTGLEIQLDRLMCSHYTTGPIAGYGPSVMSSKVVRHTDPA